MYLARPKVILNYTNGLITAKKYCDTIRYVR